MAILTNLPTDAVPHPFARVRRLPSLLILTAVAVQTVGPSALLVGVLAIAAVTEELVSTDLTTSRLPNRLVLPCYPAAAAGIAGHGILTGSSPGLALAAGGSWFLFLLLLNVGGGMGMGDVKLAGVLGLCLGSVGLAPAVTGLLIAFTLGGVAAVVVLARRVGGYSARIPFGPFLLAGFWIALALTPGSP